MAAGPIVSCHFLDGVRFYTVFKVSGKPTIQGEPGQLSGYSDSLRTGRSGDRMPVEGGGARFFAPVQTGRGAHPASHTVGTGSFPELKRPERGVDHPPHLGPRLKKE